MNHLEGDAPIIGTFLSFVKNFNEIFFYVIDKLDLYTNFPTIHIKVSFLIG